MNLKNKYISFMQKVHPNKVNPNVEWISFHLPKTGGVSFRNYLNEVYMEEILYVYSAPLQGRINNELPIWTPPSKVIHGHFQPNKNLKTQFPNAKWVIWLRDPKKRLISHYNFWKSQPQSGPAFEYFKENINSFQEFVLSKRLNAQVCLYQTYLRRVKIDDFDFIGILENVNEDLLRFSKMIGKNIINMPHSNKSEKLKEEDYTFTEEMEKVISGELDIYQQAIKLKNPS